MVLIRCELVRTPPATQVSPGCCILDMRAWEGIFEMGGLPFPTNIKYRSVLKPKYLSGFKNITTYENKWHYTPRKYGLLYEYFNL